MSESIRVLLLLAKMPGDTEPCVVAAIDEVIWENWDEATETEWIADGKRTWGIERGSEFKVVTAVFAPQDLVDAFETPEVRGAIA